MKKHTFLAATLLAFTTLSPAQTPAVPNFISYQGRVVDATGNNVGSGTPVNRTVIFRIWNSQSSTDAGNLIYSESQNVSVSEGEFSVLVGQGVANSTQTFGYLETDKKLIDLATAFNGSELYLGVTVAATNPIAITDNEITPRQRIVSTAFAMRSRVAETVISDAIGTGNIVNSSVTLAKMAAASVNSSSIVDSSIVLADLAGNSVNGSKIVDGSVALADLAADSVVGSKIVDGSVALADLAVNSVDSSKIVDGSIGNADIGTNAAIVDTKLATIGTAGKVADSALSGNVALLTGTQTFTGQKNFSANVGIGTTTPNAPLHVVGNSSQTFLLESLLTTYGAENTSINGHVAPVGIEVANAVKAQYFAVLSDERIKDIVGQSKSAEDLETLLDIEVTDYRHKDKLTCGSKVIKKVIAQQVEKVFPAAISRSTGVIPDIYQQAKVEDGWIQIESDLKVGERVRLISKTADEVVAVTETREGGFRTASKPSGEKVFVYGREVDDFRAVDYEAIAMLNVSATQQIKKEKDAEVNALREENAGLRSRIAALEAKDTARDAKMAAIEKLLASPDQSATRTVSLKTAE